MMDEKLRPFQRRFVKAVESSSYDTVALSGPRGLGKTFLAGHVLARALTPGDKLNQPGAEYVLGAASLDQARMTYAFVRAALEPSGEYRFIDSTTRLGITHKASNTKLRAISSNAKSAFGLVNVPMAVIDEPGALEIVGGQMMADALFTAQGKVGSALKLVISSGWCSGGSGKRNPSGGSVVFAAGLAVVMLDLRLVMGHGGFGWTVTPIITVAGPAWVAWSAALGRRASVSLLEPVTMGSGPPWVPSAPSASCTWLISTLFTMDLPLCPVTGWTVRFKDRKHPLRCPDGCAAETGAV